MGSVRAALPERFREEGKEALGNPAEIELEMAAGGFREVAVHTRTHTLPAASPSAFWGLMRRATAPAALLRRRLGEADWADFARRLDERLRSELGEGPIEATFTAHLGVGTR
jgi:hypothetical protein